MLFELISKKSLSLAYNNRGHLHYKKVLFDLAIDDYTNAINIDDKLSVAYYNRATIYYRIGKPLN